MPHTMHGNRRRGALAPPMFGLGGASPAIACLRMSIKLYSALWHTRSSFLASGIRHSRSLCPGPSSNIDIIAKGTVLLAIISMPPICKTFLIHCNEIHLPSNLKTLLDLILLKSVRSITLDRFVQRGLKGCSAVTSN